MDADNTIEIEVEGGDGLSDAEILKMAGVDVPQGGNDQPAGDTGTDLGEGDGTDTGAENTETGKDDWTPPTREEWEAMKRQNDLVTGLADDQLESMLSAGDTDVSDTDAQTPPSEDDVTAAMTPKNFALPPETLSKILVDGDQEALVGAFNHLIDVVQHNARIDMNKSIMNGLNYAQPVYTATSKFYDKYPELLGAREIVENHMWQTRMQHPQANDLQILRAVEKRLGPVIDKARQIAKQKAAQQQQPGKRTNMAPGPSAGGQQSPPRGRTTGGNKPEVVSTEDALNRLRQFDKAH